MKHQLGERGTGLVEALLVLVVVGLIGFTGWYVWQSKNSVDATLSNVNQGAVAKVTPKIKSFEDCKASAGSKLLQTSPEQCVTASGQKFTAVSTQQYLTVKEWGIRFKLTSEIADAYYNRKDNNPNNVYLSVNTFKGTDCSAESVSEGAIFRFTASDKNEMSGNLYTKDLPNAAHVGSYYYGYIHQQSGCSDDSSIQLKASNISDAFNQAAKTIEVAN